MLYRSLSVGLLSLIATIPLWAQISRDARFEILRTVMADQAAARIAMPFGTNGVDLTDAGEVNKEKVEADIKKNGQSIEVGKVVTVTEISFGDKQVEIELDGGGKNKKGFLDRLEVGVGTQTRPVSKDDPKKAKGSKVVLKFASKVPADLSPEQLKQLLSPVLDFEKRNFLKTGIDALPPEFQEAVKVKEARIGMDRSTVSMALGRPDKKVREKVDGIDTEDWIYFQRGLRAQFVTFENDIVVRIRQY
jgi:hypothetical protein